MDVGAVVNLSPRGFVALGVLALGTRLLYMALVIPHYAAKSDALQYEQLARSIADGNGFMLKFPFSFLHATGFRPPAYPALLGSVWAVTGASVGIGQVVNVVLGCVAVVLAAVLAGRIGGRTAALAAGVAASLYPPLIANDTTLLSEPLSLVLLLAVVILLLDRRVEWAAVLSGVLVLTRPSAQAFAVVLAAWIVWRIGWKSALRYAALVLLVVAPWVARNWLVAGEPVLVTSNGFNLAAVYSPTAQQEDGFVDPVYNPAFQQARYLHYDEADWDRTLRKFALDHVAHHPSSVLRVVRQNANAWFELPPSRNQSPEELDGRNLDFRNATIFLFYLVTAAGLAGLIITFRSRVSELLLICAAYFCVFSLLTVAPPRLRAPFDIAMCIGVGALLARIAVWRRKNTPLLQPRDAEVRPDRSWALRTFVVVAVVGLVALIAGTLFARSRVQENADRSVRSALHRFGNVPGRVASYFPVSATTTSAPPFANGRALDDLKRLEADLWRASVRMPSSERAATRQAAIDVSRARTESSLLGVYLAFEAISSQKRGVPFDLNAALDRYARNNRSTNRLLPTPRALLDGAAARDAARSVARLRRELAAS